MSSKVDTSKMSVVSSRGTANVLAGNVITRREGKRFLFEAGFLSNIVAFIFLFIAFCSPYWIISWPRVYSGFKRMGLWEACFAGLLLETDITNKAYHGCWWMLAPEFWNIRGWLMPGWFIFTQVGVTLCFIAEVVSIIIQFLIWLKTGGKQKDGRYKQKDPLILLQTTVWITIITGILMVTVILVFSICFATDRLWLPNPYLNYLSWSFGMAVVSTFFTIFAIISHVTYLMIVHKQMTKPPRRTFVMPFSRVTPVPNPDTGVLCPVGRSGHCATADGSGTMCVYGGFNPQEGPFNKSHDPAQSFCRQVMPEVWRFNLTTRVWSEVQCWGDVHTTAASATVVMLHHKLLLYGGTIVPWGKEMSSTLTVCDLDTGHCEVVAVTSPTREGIPPPGYGQSMLQHGDCIYVFTGAVSFLDEPISDLHRFDLREGQWEKMPAEGALPRGRYKQEMIYYDNRLFLLGGGHELESVSLNHVHVYCLERNMWEIVHCFGDNQSAEHFPRPRASFVCIRHDVTLYIFGGRLYKDDEDWSLDDVWTLSLVSFQWRKLPVTLPTPLYFHTGVLAPSGFVYIYGGILPSQRRNSEVCRLKIFVGKLSELSWEALTIALDPLEKWKPRDLVKLGVPNNFAQRISRFARPVEASGSIGPQHPLAVPQTNGED